MRDRIERIERSGALHFGPGLFALAHTCEGYPQIAVRKRIARIQRDRLSEGRLRADPIPVEPELDDSERALDLGEVRLGPDCLRRSLPRAWPCR